jgi:menaquinone-9 beta-reductase
VANNTLSYYQVAVIGGGLAGLSLAIQAADAGYSVVLFEKESYPFRKVCGEYISMESYDFLQRLGVPLVQLNIAKINRLQLSDMSGRLYDFDLPLGGFGISRYKLDDCLYNIALQKGVQVFTETKVSSIDLEDNRFTVTTSSGNITTERAAGAFGKRSNLDVKWKRPFVLQKKDKLNNYIGVKYHIRYQHPVNTIALHNFSNGYCGMSAIEDGKSCLCYLTTAANLQTNSNSISKMEKQVLQQNPQLQRIFSKAEFLYSEPLTISQVSFNKKAQVENGVLMLGDAAGMITPLCGNGMSMALHGSKLAFESIHPFLQQKITRTQMEAAYTKQWQQQFASRLWAGRQVQKLFGGKRSTAIFLKTMYKLPFVSKKVIAATHGKPF